MLQRFVSSLVLLASRWCISSVQNHPDKEKRMRIKMIHEISGLIDGRYWPARGGVIDVNDDEAQRLIAVGGAEIADESDVDASEATGATEVESAAADESDVETAAVATEPKKRTARKV